MFSACFLLIYLFLPFATCLTKKKIVQVGRQFLTNKNENYIVHFMPSWGVRKVKHLEDDFFLKCKTKPKHINEVIKINTGWRGVTVTWCYATLQRVKIISRQQNHTRFMLVLLLWNYPTNFVEKPESLYGRISCTIIFTLLNQTCYM